MTPRAWTVKLWCGYVDHLHRFFIKYYSTPMLKSDKVIDYGNDDHEWFYQVCKVHDPYGSGSWARARPYKACRENSLYSLSQTIRTGIK